jgi:hypothetical protein
VYVYERVLLQPVPTSAPRAEVVMTGVPVQLSVAVAVPAAGNEVGLQPSEEEAGQEVNTGASVSAV